MHDEAQALVSTVIFSYVTVMKQIFGQPQVLSKKERHNFEIYDFTKLCQYYLCINVLSLFAKINNQDHQT
jgi:hypothetical protein